MSAAAAQVGLAYDFEALQPANTVLAHQLLHFAKQHGRQLAAYERLFQAHFEQGRHVGRLADLAELAVEIGLDRDLTVAALESGQFLAAVRADEAVAADRGIRSVPYVVIAGRPPIIGAQPAQVFADALAAVVTDPADGSEQH